jgi:hypothetical protein
MAFHHGRMAWSLVIPCGISGGQSNAQVLLRVVRFTPSRVIPPVFHSYCHFYTQCILNAGTDFRIEFPAPNKEKSHIHLCPQTLSFLSIAPPVHQTSILLELCLGGHIQFVVYSAPIGNEHTLDHHIFYVCQTIRNRPGPFERVRQSMIRRVPCIHWFRWTFWTFVMDCGSNNHKNRPVICLGMCAVSVLCHL